MFSVLNGGRPKRDAEMVTLFEHIEGKRPRYRKATNMRLVEVIAEALQGQSWM